jgi:hypothetical protein
MNKEIVYRAKPSAKCPYSLDTTPQTHYAGFMYKAAEIVLINRFGLKNIPRGAFWKMSATSSEITDAFTSYKKPWGLFRILGVLKKDGYGEEAILLMLKSHNIKLPTMKYVASYKFWCKKQEELRRKQASLRYNKTDDVVVLDEPVVEIEQKPEEQNLRDWLD